MNKTIENATVRFKTDRTRVEDTTVWLGDHWIKVHRDEKTYWYPQSDVLHITHDKQDWESES